VKLQEDGYIDANHRFLSMPDDEKAMNVEAKHAKILGYNSAR
jgi:hypothetical protein